MSTLLLLLHLYACVDQVHSYRLTAQHAGGIRPAPGWVYAMGAVRRSGGSSISSKSGGGDVLMMCFSRQAMSKASLVPNLDPTSECGRFILQLFVLLPRAQLPEGYSDLDMAQQGHHISPKRQPCTQ